MAKPRIPDEYREFLYEFTKGMQVSAEMPSLPTMHSLLDFFRVIVSIEEERGSWAEFLEKVRDRCQENIEICQAIRLSSVG